MTVGMGRDIGKTLGLSFPDVLRAPGCGGRNAGWLLGSPILPLLWL